MEWRWNQRKAVANKVKHGVSFELATLVFADPLHLSQLDSHPDESGGRIISARKATAYERHAYEEGI